MGTKITKLERIKSKAVRVALTAFRTNPLLGACQPNALFAEILSNLKAGMNEADIVEAVIKNHAIEQPRSQLSLMM